MKVKNMNKFDFDDINLLPNMGIVGSRSLCDASVIFNGRIFKSPVIPANMECIIDENISKKLAEAGYFYILHRFLSDQSILNFIIDMNSSGLPTSISIGVNKDSYELINKIKNMNLNVDYITIDIAHGHSIKMQEMLKFLKSEMPKSFLIAGNVCTQSGVLSLSNWGADAVKVGIGNGSACTTYSVTGFGSRGCQASTVYNCSSFTDIPIISDGGIKTPGDISKALVMGAKMVMVGGMLSGFEDSPGDVVVSNGVHYKEFWGSASEFQSDKRDRVEGRKLLIEKKSGTILDHMKYLVECIESAISYAGGNEITFFENVNWYGKNE